MNLLKWNVWKIEFYANVKKANLETIFLQLFELIYSKQQCILEPESRSKEHIIKY